MAKKQTTQDYITELRTMIETKNDGVFDPWLMPLLRATAMNMVILDKMQEKLESEEVASSMTGSMGQQKIGMHPLLDKYDKMQNTLVRQFEALGLTNKSKKTEDDNPDDDPLVKLLKEARK